MQSQCGIADIPTSKQLRQQCAPMSAIPPANLGGLKRSLRAELVARARGRAHLLILDTARTPRGEHPNRASAYGRRFDADAGSGRIKRGWFGVHRRGRHRRGRHTLNDRGNPRTHQSCVQRQSVRPRDAPSGQGTRARLVKRAAPSFRKLWRRTPLDTPRDFQKLRRR